MKSKVLFLCTGNSCRSQMAEGWLRHLGGNRFEAYSAGIEAHGMNPRAIATMHAAGVDIRQQQSEVLNPKILDKMDLLISVCSHADQHCPIIPSTCAKQHWPFDDPAQAQGSEEEVMREFQRVCTQIRQRIEVFLHSSSPITPKI